MQGSRVPRPLHDGVSEGCNCGFKRGSSNAHTCGYARRLQTTLSSQVFLRRFDVRQEPIRAIVCVCVGKNHTDRGRKALKLTFADRLIIPKRTLREPFRTSAKCYACTPTLPAATRAMTCVPCA
jgi:hypothetical protein